MRNDTLDFHVCDKHPLCADRITHFWVEEEQITASEKAFCTSCIQNDPAIHTGGNGKCQPRREVCLDQTGHHVG